jgi:hypothetical protein
MLYRETLLGLGGCAVPFLQELSRRHRDRLAPEVLAVYALYEQYGEAELLAAMALASQAGSYSAAALECLLTTPQRHLQVQSLVVPGVPPQSDVDRLLSSYEAWVHIDEAQMDELMVEVMA